MSDAKRIKELEDKVSKIWGHIDNISKQISGQFDELKERIKKLEEGGNRDDISRDSDSSP